MQAKQWTGDIVAKMHLNKITSIQLAGKIGWHPKYLSMVLNGKRTPKQAEDRVRTALDELIKNKNEPVR